MKLWCQQLNSASTDFRSCCRRTPSVAGLSPPADHDYTRTRHLQCHLRLPGHQAGLSTQANCASFAKAAEVTGHGKQGEGWCGPVQVSK